MLRRHPITWAFLAASAVMLVVTLAVPVTLLRYVLPTSQLLLLAAGAVAAALRWRANAYRRAASRELERVEAAQEWAQLSEVLKRTALATFPRESVAGLTGTDWLAFLDRTGGTRDFTEGPGRALTTLAYDPRAAERVSDDDARAAHRACTAWVQRHRGDRAEGAVR